MDNPELLRCLGDLGDRYDALLCDVWGCLHNGIEPYPAAVAALQSFRAQGGTVVLLTNAPTVAAAVRAHLLGLGAPEDAFDAIVTAGDAARAEVASLKHGRRVFVIGCPRDAALWNGLSIELTALEKADVILCAGLDEDRDEQPEAYDSIIAEAVARDLPFICANPDVVVDQGDRRLYCAGAVAERYDAAGGRVFMFGKPHPDIYALALAEITRLRGAPVERGRTLAVGDGVATDVLGARREGVDCVYVTGGLAMEELAADPSAPDPERPDPGKLAAHLLRHGCSPRYAIGRLR